MSSRRSLLSRQNRDAESPQLQRNRQPTALPPYEPPTCPLTETGKRALAAISANHDYRKYEKHLSSAVKNITDSAGESNDRLYLTMERARKMAQRKEAADGDNDKIKAIEEAEKRALALEIKVEKLTAESEKALRELIDYKEELGWQDAILKKVGEDATAASSTTNRARRTIPGPNLDSVDENGAFQDSAEDEDDEMAGAESSAAIMSPIELLKKIKDEYSAEYKSKTMRARYAEHNDYIGFKRLIHDAQNPGDNAPPVPHASNWFPEEDSGHSSNPSAARRRRRMVSRTDNTENGEDDDDIQMTGVVSSLKCPLTLRTFQEPYSNRICKHTFEKSAILEFHHENAIAFVDPSQGPRRRGVRQGPKQLKCPERGCEAMLELKDFYDDQTILRQVKRQAAQAAAETEEDLDGDEDVLQGTQRSRPQDVDSGADDFDDIDQNYNVKKERMSQGLGQSAAPSDESEDDDPEPI